jgi:hypothetical protein
MRKGPVVKFISDPREALGSQDQSGPLSGTLFHVNPWNRLDNGNSHLSPSPTVSANDLIGSVQEFEDVDQSVHD